MSFAPLTALDIGPATATRKSRFTRRDGNLAEPEVERRRLGAEIRRLCGSGSDIPGLGEGEARRILPAQRWPLAAFAGAFVPSAMAGLPVRFLSQSDVKYSTRSSSRPEQVQV